MATKSLPEIVNEFYKLLDPLDTEDRQRVITSVMALFGEVAMPSNKLSHGSVENHDEDGDGPDGSTFTATLGKNAKRWLNQYGVTAEMLEEVFHRDNGKIAIIASKVPGESMRDKAKYCYLLAGIRFLLEKDEAKFDDAIAIEVCTHYGCYNSPNHNRTRKDLGSLATGNKKNGFTLPAPGLRAAADLIKEMTA